MGAGDEVQLNSTRRRLFERIAAGTMPRPAPPAPRRAPLTLDSSDVGAFYDEVSRSLDSTAAGPWSLFLNLGYLAGPDDWSPIRLPGNTLDASSVKLVLEVVGTESLDGADILDVGAGRGGTIHTLLEYFQPRTVTGVELSPVAAAFNRRVNAGERAACVVGDAQHLPFSGNRFDAVTNIESSHCYPDRYAFYAEVQRVLRPGGVFLYSDLLPTESLPAYRAECDRLGFDLEHDRDITANVLGACDRIAKRRQESFANLGNDVLENFLAAPGSPTYEALRSGEQTFFVSHLRLRHRTGAPSA
jgi:phthiocerol/phenolphthiocerol synthesis type-I polyketide synthase E